MKFIRTTAINKILKMNKRIKVIPGGTSAGKTFGILPVLIDKATKESNLEISVVSESIPHLRKGALKDFLKIMKSTGRYVDAHYNRTLLTYTFSNGSFIEFFSADQEGKVRGPRRHKLYINECNNLTFETYHQLAIRTSDEIYLDFNPSHPFWVHEELKEEDEDVEWLTLTYKDNEGLPISIVKEIEKAKAKAETSNYWANWWKVYGLGQLGILEGVIFQDWKQVDKIPENAKLLGRGLDFGYTNDPTTLIACYEYNGQKIFHEEIHETGLLNSDIIKRLKSLGIKSYDAIYADAAEPKSIEEIRRAGFAIKAAKKGADSIVFGVGLLQQAGIVVTRSSTNLIKELRNYVWDTDKNGNKLNKPIDYFNHCIDAMRYFAIEKLTTKKSKSFSISV